MHPRRQVLRFWSWILGKLLDLYVGKEGLYQIIYKAFFHWEGGESCLDPKSEHLPSN